MKFKTRQFAAFLALSLMASALAADSPALLSQAQGVPTKTVEPTEIIPGSADPEACINTIARVQAERGFAINKKGGFSNPEIQGKGVTLYLPKYDLESKLNVNYGFSATSYEERIDPQFSRLRREFSDPHRELVFRKGSVLAKDVCVAKTRLARKRGGNVDYNACFQIEAKKRGLDLVDLLTSDSEKKQLAAAAKNEKDELTQLAVRRAHCMGTQNKPYRKLTETWVAPDKLLLRTEGCAYDADPRTHLINGTVDHYIDFPSCKISRVDIAPDLPLSKKPETDFFGPTMATMGRAECELIAKVASDSDLLAKETDPDQVLGLSFRARYVKYQDSVCGKLFKEPDPTPVPTPTLSTVSSPEPSPEIKASPQSVLNDSSAAEPAAIPVQ